MVSFSCAPPFWARALMKNSGVRIRSRFFGKNMAPFRFGQSQRCVNFDRYSRCLIKFEGQHVCFYTLYEAAFQRNSYFLQLLLKASVCCSLFLP
ncbi:hypothetical protein CEXT_65661 [Caerostris extrusa]|uniref:Secreted protein n=1 Tax=Caerostris extrusa TaxID=172846 RepID=A0AAV4QXJ1_CAEEX|nr:hypothetical protein CEXT_65661 [Caerostris extrusa]